MGKTMKEHLKFALSWWHTMGGDGTDMFGCGTTDKSWGESSPEARAKAKVDAAFEIMDKLSIDYFCYHDRDLSPEYGDLATTNEKFQEIVDYVAEKMKADPSKKLLWGTAKCFDHPRYMHGAGTSPSADVFAYSAAQIKKAIDMGVAKVNVNTECQLVFAAATRKYIEEGKDQQGKGYDPRKLLAPGAQAIRDEVKDRVAVFGSANKA